MRQRVHHRGGHGQRSTNTNGVHNPAQLRHRRVRGQLLQIVLLQSKQRRHNRGEHADDDEQTAPPRVVMEERGETQEQVNSRFHDGCRVEEGGHRSICRHRLGEPEVEGELRRLRARRRRNQHGDDGEQRGVMSPLRRMNNPRQAGRTRHTSANTQTGQQRKPTKERQNDRAH